LADLKTTFDHLARQHDDDVIVPAHVLEMKRRERERLRERKTLVTAEAENG
jgi:hypothetical protein